MSAQPATTEPLEPPDRSEWPSPEATSESGGGEAENPSPTPDPPHRAALEQLRPVVGPALVVVHAPRVDGPAVGRPVLLS